MMEVGLDFKMLYNINMNFIKKSWQKIVRVSFLSMLPVVSLAVCNPTKGMICNPITTNTINEFIKIFLEGILKIGMPLIALAIIYCGFLFVAARGNSEKITKAKDALLYTLIGAAVLLGSWAIAELISNTVLAL